MGKKRIVFLIIGFLVFWTTYSVVQQMNSTSLGQVALELSSKYAQAEIQTMIAVQVKPAVNCMLKNQLIALGGILGILTFILLSYTSSLFGWNTGKK